MPQQALPACDFWGLDPMCSGLRVALRSKENSPKAISKRFFLKKKIHICFLVYHMGKKKYLFSCIPYGKPSSHLALKLCFLITIVHRLWLLLSFSLPSFYHKAPQNPQAGKGCPGLSQERGNQPRAPVFIALGPSHRQELPQQSMLVFVGPDPLAHGALCGHSTTLSKLGGNVQQSMK